MRTDLYDGDSYDLAGVECAEVGGSEADYGAVSGFTFELRRSSWTCEYWGLPGSDVIAGWGLDTWLQD